MRSHDTCVAPFSGFCQLDLQVSPTLDLPGLVVRTEVRAPKSGQLKTFSFCLLIATQFSLSGMRNTACLNAQAERLQKLKGI